jgi:hypothetical protein
LTMSCTCPRAINASTVCEPTRPAPITPIIVRGRKS